MVNLKRLLMVLGCLLLFTGCASQLGKQATGSAGVSEKNQQQLTQRMEEMYQLGRKQQEAAQFSEAITTYEHILAINPNHAEAHNGLGVIYAIQGRFEPALQHLQKAVSLAPLASHLRNNLGYAYLLMGRDAEAIGAFEHALRLDPENVNARANLNAIRNKTETTGD
nr:tetratricopeptide repeat protein [Nitrosomonas nitrosa]